MGVMSGDPRPGSAIVWSATDREARMWVEWSNDPGFRNAKRIEGPTTRADTGFTSQVRLTGLPAGDVHYRVRFEDSSGRKSKPESGRLWTPSTDKRNVRIGWGGDVAGQDFGIDQARGGMRMFDVLRKRDLDLFIHSGDHIYADVPLSSSHKLDNGEVWKNLVTPAKQKVAETLDEFRGQYAYNMLDPNYRAFFAEVPVIAQWDDHELRNNWYPGQILDDDRYTEKSVDVLTSRAKQAFKEFMPMQGTIHRHLPQGPSLDVFVLDARSFRGPNSPNRQRFVGKETAFFGEQPLAALKAQLMRSKATWKIIASDMPLSTFIYDGKESFEGMANGEGPPLGREHELASLLKFLKMRKIRNVVFVTADVHYAAAHHYAPDRATFTDFDPFWEFIAGPLHAGTFGPSGLDPTFGPELAFLAVPPDLVPNRAPTEGYQFFGEINLDGKTERLSVSLHDIKGRTLYTKTLDPVFG